MPGWIIACIIVCSSCFIAFVHKSEELRNIHLHSKEFESFIIACMVACIIFGMTVTTYRIGHHIARKYELISGLTENQYRKDKWKYRTVLSGLVFLGGTGVIMAVAFDDYFIGI